MAPGDSATNAAIIIQTFIIKIKKSPQSRKVRRENG
jgi:hypothetical protein